MNGLPDAMHGLLKFVAEVSPVVFLMGLFGLFLVMLTRRKGARTAMWPTVEGVVTSVRVEKIRKAASSIGHGDNPKVTFYKPRISYSYEIHGARLLGNRIQFGMAKRERVKLQAEQTIREYSVGQAVRVHYDPKAPKESVLETGVHLFWKKRLSFVLGMMALGCGGWILAMMLRQI